MVLILTNESDLSTNDVIDYLLIQDIPFIRVNQNSIVKIYDLALGTDYFDFSIDIDDFHKLKFSDISATWYRRGWVNLAYVPIPKSNELAGYINDFLNRESTGLLHLFYQKFDLLPGIGSFYHNETNKLINIENAKKSGLNVPDTVIVTTKSNLLRFFKTKKSIVTKNMNIGLSATIDGETINAYTAEISSKHMKDIPNKFPPTLFQESIQKKFEIRVFFLNNLFYSTAIMSQKDLQTRIDFRKYNRNKPNRLLPYQLPKFMIDKLILFMAKCGMNSGSIDLIYSCENKYYFLEVNPIGQFAQFSKPCNYYLEREIAAFLGNNDGLKLNRTPRI